MTARWMRTRLSAAADCAGTVDPHHGIAAWPTPSCGAPAPVNKRFTDRLHDEDLWDVYIVSLSFWPCSTLEPHICNSMLTVRGALARVVLFTSGSWHTNRVKMFLIASLISGVNPNTKFPSRLLQSIVLRYRFVRVCKICIHERENVPHIARAVEYFLIYLHSFGGRVFVSLKLSF